jgi:hypothetical protein
MPSPAWRRNCPQVLQVCGGFLAGPGREHDPHQPVASRNRPGLPHRGQGDFAACALALRRQGLQWVE